MAIVQATWVGPFVGEHPDGQLLQPGDTCEILDAQLSSGHFKPVAKPQTRKADS